MKVENRGNIFPIEPIDQSSRVNNDRKPRLEKLKRKAKSPDLAPSDEKTMITDDVEISEATRQALEAYQESLDTGMSDETDHWDR